MQRKWYKKESGRWHEAPCCLETERGYIGNYNTDANEPMLREDGYLPENEITESMEEVPEKISNLQMQVQLAKMGITPEMLEAELDKIEDTNQRAIAKIALKTSTSMYRDNDMIELMAQMMGWTSEQVDEFFINAKKILL